MSPRVLLIDDDVAEISSVKRALARCRGRAVLATSASEAVAAIAERPPALVLVGADCDGGKALALARRLLDGERSRVRVMVLGDTAEAPAAAILIPRPLDPAQLADEVDAALRSATVAPAAGLARVREKLEQVRGADYFAILGLPRTCTPDDVGEHAERLAASFDPGRFAAYPDEALRESLREILQVVADAREVLADDLMRAEYSSGLGE